jgi:hypothetical protein
MMPPESWIGFFEWAEATWVGTTIQQSLWLFPVIEAVHLVALCVLGGALIIVDLRLLGWGLRDQPVDALARYVRPWFRAGVTVMLTTGVLLFLSEAIKCFYNTSFWVKMVTLAVALTFTFAVRNRVAMAGPETSTRTRLIGGTSLVLWFVVAAAGRWIGYS